jgi:flagellar basal body-associated protein FliL
MSEEVKEAKEVKAKKKGKLPIILVLVLVIAGGGFFMKSKGAPKKVEIKAGTVEALDKEFLINLNSGPSTFLRAEIAFQMRDGFTKEELDASMIPIRNCIIQIFRSKSLQEVGADQTDALRKEIAESVNTILISHMKDEEKKVQAELEKAAAQSKPDASKNDKKSADDKNGGEAKDDLDPSKSWVSKAGPVLDVYFTSFTTQ